MSLTSPKAEALASLPSAADFDAANKAFDIAFRGETDGIDAAMVALFTEHRIGPIVLARDCFLNMIADARRFDEDNDGDEGGVTATYFLEVDGHSFGELAEVLGIKQRWMESWGDAISRTIDEEAAQAEQPA